MISNEVLTEELLQQAAAEMASALNDSLPPPNECRHKFSESFEQKMQTLIRGIGTTCYTVEIQDPAIHK